MRDQDAGEAVRILPDWIAETPWMPMLHTADDMHRFWACRLRETKGWTVHAPHGLQGFAIRDGATISALCFDRDARGPGLGAVLIEHLKTGADRLMLWTFAANLRAQDFTDTARTDGKNEDALTDVKLGWYR